jgi:hypothetical protein
MYVYNMDYEKKYLKYKSKYNLKKSSLVRGGEKIMTGGNIEVIATLVRNDTSMINKTELLGQKPERLSHDPPKNIIILSGQIRYMEETLENKDIIITPAWTPYIHFDSVKTQNGYKYFVLSFISSGTPINPNGLNSRGQTLLYLAAQNCNKIMFDALVAMGADPMVLNGNGSSILHGIAWGKLAGEPGVIATYDEKKQFMEYIFVKYPQTISLLFTKNSANETYFDNLLMRHPETISTGLKKSMLPINPLRQGWLEQFDNESQRTFYADTIGTGGSLWDRPSLWVIQGDTTPYYYNMDTKEHMSVEQFNLTYKEPI